jgi:hypothetical protein
LFGPDGKLIRIAPPIPIDRSFVESANEGRAPLKRFRFTADCAEDRCGQWRDGKCGVAEQALISLAEFAGTDDARMPACAIRSTCRWFAQEGSRICGACSHVTTDQS